MNDVFVTCIKNGRSDQFGRPMVSGSSYTLPWMLAKSLWQSGYVSHTSPAVFNGGGTNLPSSLSLQNGVVIASRQLNILDVGNTLFCNSTDAIELMIMADDVSPWPGNTAFAIHQSGSGAASFVAGPLVTIIGTAPTPAQGATQTIMRIPTSANTWAYL